MTAQIQLTTLMLILMAVLPVSANADWVLDGSQSTLSFITVKAQDVAEVHTFSQLSGSVGGDGKASVVIDLASVDTLIPIRDERMREIVFQTEVFPTAMATVQLDPQQLQEMTAGTRATLTTEIVLAFKDAEIPVTAELLIARMSTDQMLVVTLKPLIINAAALSLTESVEQLREMAGLPSISKAVPVSFVLQFTKAD